MDLTTRKISGITVLACEGRMSLGDGAEQLATAFADELPESKKGIVLDLTRLIYLDSAGVGAVVSCAKKAAASGVVMKIALARFGPVRKIFEVTQLERGFEIFDDAASAAASFA